MSKKVLILSYYSPPNRSVGGMRTIGWTKYLGHYNIEGTLLTKRWGDPETDENLNIEYVDFPLNKKDKLIEKYGHKQWRMDRKLLTLKERILNRFFPQYGVYAPLFRKACELIEKGEYNILICSGEPFTLFQFGRKLNSKYGIPWVADYRDGWSTNYDRHLASFWGKLKYDIFDRYWEKKSVKSASLISTVSKPVADDLSEIFPTKNVAIIENGYDEEVHESLISKERSTKELSIAYSGTIYPFQRLNVFADGLNLAFQKKRDMKIKVHFYGLPEYSVSQVKNAFETMEDIIQIHPYLPHKEALSRLNMAHVFLLLANENIDGSCTKVYEYLALERPILLCVDDKGTLSNLMTTCKAGFISQNPEDVCTYILHAYDSVMKNGDLTSTTIDYTQFGKKHLTEKLANELKEIV